MIGFTGLSAGTGCWGAMEQKMPLRALGGSLLGRLGQVSEWSKLSVLDRVGQRERGTYRAG